MSKPRVLFTIFLFAIQLGSSWTPTETAGVVLREETGSMGTDGLSTQSPTGQGKLGGRLVSLIRDRGKPYVKAMPRLDKVIQMMELKGGAQTVIGFDHLLTDVEINTLEKDLGLKFHRVYGNVQAFSPIYSVIVPWEQITAVSDLSYVKSMDTDLWPPPVSTLASSVVATKADFVWPLLDGQGRTISGKGIKIAVTDTGVDVFHPDLWQPDPAEAQYEWTDGNGNGRPDNDGDDRVYIPGVGNQVLRFIDADGSGVFNADTDWLYADSDNNGKRDYGRPRFSENDKSYGERIFIAADTNGNNQLDPGEKLIALSVNKVYKTRSADGTVRTRGVNLIDTPRDTDGHGTYVAGIVSGGSSNSSVVNDSPYYFRKYVGAAPEIVVKQGDQWVGGLLIAAGHAAEDYAPFQDWAVAENADVMLYEHALWVKSYLDGSELTETRVTNLADSGKVQVLGAGNLAGNPATFGSRAKHFQKVINNVENENVIPFFVPDGITLISQSLIWRSSSNNLSFKLITPTENDVTINLGSQTGSTTWDGHNIYYYRFTSGSFTARFDIDIIKTTPTINPSTTKNWRLKIVNAGDNEELNGYLVDSKEQWSGDVEYLAGGDPNWINPSKTVAFPATADKALVVGAYHDFWGSFFLGSSRGPRVDSTPQNPKPLVDIVAPGQNVTSARSVKADQDLPGYLGQSGTSPAAAYVAGAVALMLQADTGPLVGRHDRVEARLKATATTDPWTGEPPDANTWGSGKLNVYSAFTKVAVKLVSESIDGNGRAAATAKVDSVKNYYTGAAVGGTTPLPSGVASYAASVSKGSTTEGIVVKNVSAVYPFNINANISANETTFSGSQSYDRRQPPVSVANLAPRLTGASNVAYPITLTFQKVKAVDGGNYTIDSPYTSSWRRGDARADGNITITDALFIAQYLAQIRGLGETTSLVHPVNAASVKQDYADGDIITIVDALYIAQMLAGLRDASYNSGASPPPGQPAKSGMRLLLDNTTVEIGSATLPPGGSAQIPVTVKAVTDSWGLGGYDFKVVFNPQVIRVDNVTAGAFAGPTRSINNTTGVVLFNAFQSTMPGPTGDVMVAYLAVTAVGGSVSSTPLNISITTLSNADGGTIPATDSDGTVTIQ